MHVIFHYAGGMVSSQVALCLSCEISAKYLEIRKKHRSENSPLRGENFKSKFQVSSSDTRKSAGLISNRFVRKSALYRREAQLKTILFGTEAVSYHRTSPHRLP
jgi:hypothetical protein